MLIATRTSCDSAILKLWYSFGWYMSILRQYTAFFFFKECIKTGAQASLAIFHLTILDLRVISISVCLTSSSSISASICPSTQCNRPCFTTDHGSFWPSHVYLLHNCIHSSTKLMEKFYHCISSEQQILTSILYLIHLCQVVTVEQTKHSTESPMWAA